jgi:hypothetical protein
MKLKTSDLSRQFALKLREWPTDTFGETPMNNSNFAGRTKPGRETRS